jgi:hypothetical protein
LKQTASNAVARGACELRECDYLCKLDRPRKLGPHRGSRRTPDGPARSGQSALGVPARSHPSGGGRDGQQVVSAARVAGHRSNRSDFAPKQSAAARSAPRHARADNSAALAAAVSAPGAETAAARADAGEQRGQPRARARAWQAATCGTLGAPVLKASLRAARSHAAGGRSADPRVAERAGPMWVRRCARWCRRRARWVRRGERRTLLPKRGGPKKRDLLTQSYRKTFYSRSSGGCDICELAKF